MHFYRIYGIVFQTIIRFYNLIEITASPSDADVLVHFGDVADDINDMIASGIKSSLNDSRAWFINDSGIFVIQNGNEIIVRPANEDISEEELASFVLGWALSFLFHQRGALAIHSTAININGKAVLIAGTSGAGKSTTALELIKRGFSYLTDDISIVDICNGNLVYPGFPIQKVCRNVADHLEDDRLQYVDERKDKFAYYNTTEFCADPLKLSAVFFIVKKESGELEMRELKSLEKWNVLMNSMFLFDAYRSLGIPQIEIQKCLQLAGEVRTVKISRPTDKDTLQEICDYIVSNA